MRGLRPLPLPPAVEPVVNPPRAGLLWALTLSSFAFNLIFAGLLLAAASRRDALAEHLLAELRRVELAPVPLALDVNVDQALPIALDVPFRETLEVPIDMSLPLDAVVTVPVDIPVLKQRVDLKVPIRATVPVRTTLQVRVDKTIPVRATLPIQMKVPVALSLDLAPFRDRVAEAAADIDWGL